MNKALEVSANRKNVKHQNEVFKTKKYKDQNIVF